ncbi:hypothetical protein [Mycoplasmopsis glycophila]|uniref:hypothetical protein n=1 Tax=Mycoplasmopsis glycophila TaxID=171285 RepID=UPI00101DF558|nr:hypothetical protein [Mycoplasmopsis glycophila]
MKKKVEIIIEPKMKANLILGEKLFKVKLQKKKIKQLTNRKQKNSLNDKPNLTSVDIFVKSLFVCFIYAP